MIRIRLATIAILVLATSACGPSKKQLQQLDVSQLNVYLIDTDGAAPLETLGHHDLRMRQMGVVAGLSKTCLDSDSIAIAISPLLQQMVTSGQEPVDNVLGYAKQFKIGYKIGYDNKTFRHARNGKPVTDTFDCDSQDDMTQLKDLQSGTLTAFKMALAQIHSGG